MANVYQTGFIPYGEEKPKCLRYPVTTGNTVALFRGSPFYLVAGNARALPSQSGTNAIKGTVVALFNSAGKSVLNLPASTAGYIEGTFEEDQMYLCAVDDTAYADANAGTMYNFLLETGTANANGYDGDGRSKVLLDGSTEAASGCNVVTIRRLTEKPDNAAATIGTTVLCKINPAYWQSGAA